MRIIAGCEHGHAHADRHGRSEGEVLHCFAPRFEPLAIAVDQADQADWRAADSGGNPGQIVVTLFRNRIQNIERVELGEPFFLATRLRW